MPWWTWLLLIGSLAEVLLGIFIGWFLAMSSGEFQSRALRDALAYVRQFTEQPVHRNGHARNGHTTDLKDTRDVLTSRQGEKS